MRFETNYKRLSFEKIIYVKPATITKKRPDKGTFQGLVF